MVSEQFKWSGSVSSESARKELPRVQLLAALNYPPSHHHLRKLSYITDESPEHRPEIIDFGGVGSVKTQPGGNRVPRSNV